MQFYQSGNNARKISPCVVIAFLLITSYSLPHAINKYRRIGTENTFYNSSSHRSSVTPPGWMPERDERFNWSCTHEYVTCFRLPGGRTIRPHHPTFGRA